MGEGGCGRRASEPVYQLPNETITKSIPLIPNFLSSTEKGPFSDARQRHNEKEEEG